jgi:hypothetical protein
MKIHEKARAYDELMQDIEKFIAELEEHSKSIEEIGNDETGKEEMGFYPSKVGRLVGSNFGLDLKIRKMQGTLNWYKSLK